MRSLPNNWPQLLNFAKMRYLLSQRINDQLHRTDQTATLLAGYPVAGKLKTSVLSLLKEPSHSTVTTHLFETKFSHVYLRKVLYM